MSQVGRNTCLMGMSAARIDRQLRERLARLDDASLPIAEINRRLGLAADELGLLRPSYAGFGVRVHEQRRERRRRGPSTARVLLEISTRARPPEALLDHLSGIGVAKLDP
jgi:hypothetical protein